MPEAIQFVQHFFGLTMKAVVIWIIFNVLISLMPIVAPAFFNASSEISRIKEAYLKGEFLLIVSAIGAGALGELFNSDKIGIAHVIIGGINFFILLFCSFGYFTVSSSFNPNLDETKYDLLKKKTNGFIISGLLTSLGCIVISKVGI